ncbi:MAG TPA: AGE family epimerase/isomerase [Opitutaceae bacterium]|nr:AGE family epimerase/isomerase [Opitutaceae bacterium]
MITHTPKLVSLFAAAVSIFCAPFAFAAAAAQADAPASAKLAQRADQELRENILPFWLKHAPDRQRGGFVGQIDQDMTVHRDAPRGVLLTSRIVWTFSAAYRRFGNAEYRDMADRGYRDLIDRAWDAQHGGVFWTVLPNGKPADAGKHIYGQAFAIYALSEYARAFNHAEAKERAIALYRLVEEKAGDRTHGGYFEGFTRDWRRTDKTLQLLGTRAPKSQNTHLHIMEAYTNLLRIWPDPELRQRQRVLIELMLNRVMDPKTHHLGLFFAADWSPLSREVSYGHDIEFAWLVLEAAEVLGDEILIKHAKAAAVAIADVTLRKGVDGDGGVFNEGTLTAVTKPAKDWWPQAEAAVGFLNAFQLTGEKRFFDAAVHTWDFIEAKVIDRAHGDWHGALARDGTPLSHAKLSLWKCPYHNGRACLELSDRLRSLVRAP